MTQLDALNPLVSYQKALTDYLTSLIPSGDVSDYEIQFSFPVPEDLRKLPMANTIIHFEQDDSQTPHFGFGDNVVQESYNSGTAQVTRSEALKYEINLDVGTWSSVESGGSTARSRAHQLLDLAFHGASAYQACQEATGGIEIVEFSGGRYVRDTESDVPLYRIVGLTLRICFYGRKDHVYGTVEEILQDPIALELDDNTDIDP